jgi:hypothetical protein
MRRRLVEEINKRISTRFRESDHWRSFFVAAKKIYHEALTRPREELVKVKETRLFHRGDWFTTDTAGRGVVNKVSVAKDGAVKVFVQIPQTSEIIEVGISNNKHSKDMLVRQAREKGFYYFSDSMTSEDYARVLDYIENYWPFSGAKNFHRFIGFIKNIDIGIDQLWSDEVTSDDYPTLEVGPFLNSVDEGGTAYPTSHVQMSYDVIDNPNPPLADLISLFYLMAPIHLVLERVASSVSAEFKYYTGLTGQLRQIEEGRLDGEVNDVIINRYFQIEQQGRWIHQGRLQLS